MIACFTTRPRTGPARLDQAGQTAGGRRPRRAGGTPLRPGLERPPGLGRPRSASPAGGRAAAGLRAGRRLPGAGRRPPPPGTVLPGFGSPPAAGAVAQARCRLAAASAPPTPRSWLADPSGRHELRYWDGTKFTEHVADAGKITIDPL